MCVCVWGGGGGGLHIPVASLFCFYFVFEDPFSSSTIFLVLLHTEIIIRDIFNRIMDRFLAT